LLCIRQKAKKVWEIFGYNCPIRRRFARAPDLKRNEEVVEREKNASYRHQFSALNAFTPL